MSNKFQQGGNITGLGQGRFQSLGNANINFAVNPILGNLNNSQALQGINIHETRKHRRQQQQNYMFEAMQKAAKAAGDATKGAGLGKNVEGDFGLDLNIPYQAELYKQAQESQARFNEELNNIPLNGSPADIQKAVNKYKNEVSRNFPLQKAALNNRRMTALMAGINAEEDIDKGILLDSEGIRKLQEDFYNGVDISPTRWNKSNYMLDSNKAEKLINDTAVSALDNSEEISLAGLGAKMSALTDIDPNLLNISDEQAERNYRDDENAGFILQLKREVERDIATATNLMKPVVKGDANAMKFLRNSGIKRDANGQVSEAAIDQYLRAIVASKASANRNRVTEVEGITALNNNRNDINATNRNIQENAAKGAQDRRTARTKDSGKGKVDEDSRNRRHERILSISKGEKRVLDGLIGGKFQGGEITDVEYIKEDFPTPTALKLKIVNTSGENKGQPKFFGDDDFFLLEIDSDNQSNYDTINRILNTTVKAADQIAPEDMIDFGFDTPKKSNNKTKKTDTKSETNNDSKPKRKTAADLLKNK